MNVLSSSCLLLIIVNCSLINWNTANGGQIRLQRTQRSVNQCVFCLNGDTIKFSVGSIANIALNDLTSWRSLICTYALEGAQHLLPEKKQMAERKGFRLARKASVISRRFTDKAGKRDVFRELIYQMLESYLQKNYANGHDCLLRLICENAQVRQHAGLLTQVLNVILLPGSEGKKDDDYSTAYRLGYSGVNCLEVYRLCPKDRNLFDEYIIKF